MVEILEREQGEKMNRKEYEEIPKERRIEKGDTILFFYPGQPPEHGLYVERIVEMMCSGKETMMATARQKVLPLAKAIEVTFGKATHSAIIHKNSYDLEYCAIELKGDFENGDH